MSPLRVPLVSRVFKFCSLSLVYAGPWLMACGEEAGDEWVSKTKELRSDKPRLAAVGSPNNTAASGERAFSWDVFKAAAKSDANSLISPLSLSLVGAMLEAGTEGETQAEIRSVFHFGDAASLHLGNNTLLQALALKNHVANSQQGDQIVKLSQDVWMKEGAAPAQSYLDILAEHYGVGAHVADYARAPEAARQAINAKVSEDTSQLIQELLKPGTISSNTLLVLTNALHLRLNWSGNCFHKEATLPAPFYGVNATREIPMLQGLVEDGLYAEDEHFEALALPTEYGELQFVALTPKTESLSDALGAINTQQIEGLLGSLNPAPLGIRMPSADIRVKTDAREVLRQLGVQRAFVPNADFFPMFGNDGERFVSAFPHEAVIHWDEQGLEAAAASAAVISRKHAVEPSKSVSLDHPFLFLVRDIESDTLLFLGQFVQPE